MSRSYKKPYVSTDCVGREAMKKWKHECNIKIRRKTVEEEIPDMGYTKKITDVWQAPDDGKHHMPDQPKATRK